MAVLGVLERTIKNIMRRSIVVSFMLMITGAILVACGSTADELRPTFAPTETFDFTARIAIQETRSAQEAEVIAVAQDTDADDTADDPTEEVVMPTVTAIPATPTSVPPTATPQPEEPTEVAEDTTEEVDLFALHPDLPAGSDPAIGEALYLAIAAPDTGQNCTVCHNVNEPVPGTGPYLYGIANVAGERVEGQTAVEYLFTSIKNPNDFIAPAQGDSVWGAGVMPQSWSQVMSDSDIYHIVAYLLTLDQSE